MQQGSESGRNPSTGRYAPVRRTVRTQPLTAGDGDGETQDGALDVTARGTRQRAQALGWLSVALGVMEIAAPQVLAQALGIKADRSTRRILLACGVRELCAGAGVLLSDKKAAWLWSRAAGDVVDLALLAAAPALKNADKTRTAAAITAIAAIAACDVWTAAIAAQEETPDDAVAGELAAHGQEIRAAVTVATSPKEAYDRWRDLEALPRFMWQLKAVTVTDAKHSRWEATGPAGTSIGWNAELTEDQPGRSIAWCSRAGSELLHAGRVAFTAAPGGQGTEVHMQLTYEPPLGPVGAAVARLGMPQEQLEADLRRFKQLIELGEVVISDATITGRDERPAQPAHLPKGRVRSKS